MKTRKKGYPGMLALTVIFTLSAVITLIPNPGASKDNMMGYHSICSAAPMSALLLIICAGITCFLRKRYFTE